MNYGGRPVIVVLVRRIERAVEDRGVAIIARERDPMLDTADQVLIKCQLRPDLLDTCGIVKHVPGYK